MLIKQEEADGSGNLAAVKRTGMNFFLKMWLDMSKILGDDKIQVTVVKWQCGYIHCGETKKERIHSFI